MNRIQDVIEKHADLLTIVTQGILSWYGHISRASGMAKPVMQGKQINKMERKTKEEVVNNI